MKLQSWVTIMKGFTGNVKKLVFHVSFFLDEGKQGVTKYDLYFSMIILAAK